MRTPIWRQWLNQTFGLRPSRNRRPDRVLLRLENLEERVVPAPMFIVNTTTDASQLHSGTTDPTIDAQNHVSLRSAIEAANNENTNSVGTVTIQFDTTLTMNGPATFVLSLNGPGDDNGLTADDIVIGSTTNLATTIIGPGDPNLILIKPAAAGSGAGGNDIFETAFGNPGVNAGANLPLVLTLQNLTLTGTGAGAIFTGADDGAGHTSVTNLTNDIFINNSDDFAQGGGAVSDVDGNLNVTDCIFEDNISTTGAGGGPGVGGAINFEVLQPSGAGAHGSLSVTDSLFVDNTATGGGIAAGGAVFVQDVAGNGNTVSMSGDTFLNNDASGAGASGGAVASTGTLGLTITTSSFNANQAGTVGGNASEGGAVFIGGPTTASTMTLDSFSHDQALGGNASGGAVFFGGSSSLTLSDSTLFDDTAINGSGIANGGGTVTANDDFWGANGGPNTTGSDATSGTVTAATWLELEAPANPTSILINNSVSLAADLFKLNTGGPLVPDTFVGLPAEPILFNNPVLGSVASDEGLPSTTIIGIIENGNIVTATTNAADDLTPGQLVNIQNVAATGFDGVFTVLSVLGPTEFTYADPALTGTSSSSGGTDTPLAQLGDIAGISSISESAAGLGTTVTVTTTNAHGFLDGQTVTISGVANANFDGTFAIHFVDATTFTYTATTSGLGSSSGGVAFLDGAANGVYTAGGTAGSGSVDVTFGNQKITVPIHVFGPIVQAADAGLTITQDGTLTITTAKLQYTEQALAASSLTYTVNTAPTHGLLKKNGVTLAANDTFTQADIDGNKITYVSTGSDTTADSFTFTVTDTNGQSMGPTAFDVTVTPPLVLTNTGLTDVNEGGTRTISNSILQASELGLADHTQLLFTINSVANLHGTLKNGVNTLGANSTFTQADLDNGNITYVNDGTANTSASFTFTVTDQTGGNSGSQTFTIGVDITTPAVANNLGLADVNKGGTRTITTTLLQFTDADDTSANVTYTVTAVPIHGTLKKNGSTATTFTQADIDANLITYVHDGTANASDSFSFTVMDAAGNVTGSNSFTIGIDITTPTEVNDAGLNVKPSGTRTITTALLDFTDADDTAANVTYTLVSLPTHGMVLKNGVQVNGNDVDADDQFTQADIDNGLITYTNDGSANATDSFSFTVMDAAGNVTTTQMFNISVDSTTPAVVNNLGLADVNKGGTRTITTTLLQFTDPDDTAANVTYTVTAVPIHGTLKKNGSTATTFTQADIDANLITYVNDGTASASDSFSFTVMDAAGNVTGSNSFSIGIDVTTPAVVNNLGLADVNKGGTRTITTTLLQFTDADDTSANVTYTLGIGPNHGTVEKNNVATTSFTQADIDANLITYVNDGTANTSDSFSFTVMDAAGNVTGSQTFTIGVDITTPSQVHNAGLTDVNKGGTRTITTGILSYTDADDTAANVTYTLGTGPNHGTVEKNNVATTTFTQADIDNGLITYVNDGTAIASDHFNFTVSDAAGNVTGSQTFTIAVDVTTPTVVNNLGLADVNKGGTRTITTAELQFTDADDTAANVTYTLVSLPTHGMVLKNGVQVNANDADADDQFTQADIDNGLITYVNDGTANTTDSFSFTVMDAAGNTTTSQTFTIGVDVTTPAVTNNLGLADVNKGGTRTITTGLLQFTDADDTSANVTYTVKSPPSDGMLEKNNVAVTTFTQADIDNNLITYTHDGTPSTTDSFSFTVQDAAGNVTGSNTFNISIDVTTPVQAANTGITVTQGGARTITTTQLQFTDADDASANVTYTVTVASSHGTLKKNNVTATTFTQADIDNGLITYVNDGTANASDSFSFTVKDAAGNVTGTQIFNITIGAPLVLFNNGGLRVVQGTSLGVTTNAELRASETGVSDALLTYTVNAVPTLGVLKKNGVALAVNGTFTQADLDNNLITYTSTGATGGDSFAFTVTDPTGGASGQRTFNLVVAGALVEFGFGQTSVPGGQNVVAISEGDDFGLQLNANNTVTAFGVGGQALNVPAGLTNVIAVAAGHGINGAATNASNDSFALALRSDGTVVGWGFDGSGQTTGGGGFGASVASLHNVVAISAGNAFALALLADGTVVAWGNNGSSQLNVPGGLSGVTAISAGGGFQAGDAFALALRSNGAVVAWGNGSSGQTAVPEGLSGVTAVSAGALHALVLKSNGTVLAWGNNGSGQLNVPQGLSGVTQIAAGSFHSLATKSGGIVVAWGNDAFGQVSQPPHLHQAVALAGGEFTSVFLAPAQQLLQAAGGEGPGSGAITQGQLQNAVSAALQRLSAAGVDAALVQRLAAAQYSVGALPAGWLGLTDVAADQVTISPDAAGHGWFVDPTPLQDEEFAAGGPGGVLTARPGAAAGLEDLETAVLHEMGHLAGLPDVDNATHPGDLMDAFLGTGVRETQALDQIFSGK